MLGDCQNAADTNWHPKQALDRSLHKGRHHTAALRSANALGDPIVDFRLELHCYHSDRLSDDSEKLRKFSYRL
jgi:hypothetical protein